MKINGKSGIHSFRKWMSVSENGKEWKWDPGYRALEPSDRHFQFSVAASHFPFIPFLIYPTLINFYSGPSTFWQASQPPPAGRPACHFPFLLSSRPNIPSKTSHLHIHSQEITVSVPRDAPPAAGTSHFHFLLARVHFVHFISFLLF